MKSSTRARVMKSHAVSVSIPRLVENPSEGFAHLGSHLSIVTANPEVLESLSAEEKTYFPEVIETEPAAAEAISKAQQIIREAEAEAEEIKQSIRRQAEEEIELWQKQTRAEIFQQMKDEGFSQGFSEGKRQGELEAKDIRRRANDLFLLAERALAEEYSQVEQQLLRLSLKIAERIMHASIKLEPKALLQVIHHLSLLPKEREGWRLNIAPEDYSWLQNIPEELPACSLINNENLKAGECFLECKEGIFDARLEIQLEKLEQLLQEELRSDGLEQVNTKSSNT